MALLSGARLCVLRKNSDGVIREVPIRTSVVKFGSEVHCTIRLKSELTEQLHCKIFVKNDKVMIANYSLKTPISVEGKVITRRALLSNGNIIEVCGTRFRWQFDESLLHARTEKAKKGQPTPTSSKFCKPRRTTMVVKKLHIAESSKPPVTTGSGRKSGPKKSRKTPTYTLPKNNKQLLKNIKKRFTMHSVMVDHHLEEEDEEMEEDEHDQDKGVAADTVSVTPKKLITPNVSKNNTPFYTPEPEKENQTPVAIGKTPRTPKTPSLETSALMILSYTPVVGPPVKHTLRKTPASTQKGGTPLMRSGYLTVRNDNISMSNTPAKSKNVAKVGNSMYLIDLTTPNSENDSSFACSLTDSSFSSSAGPIDLTTPPPKKLKTPSSTIAKSSQKGLLRSALKNASRTPLSAVRSRLAKDTPKSVERIRLDDSVGSSKSPLTPTKGRNISRPTTPVSSSKGKLRHETAKMTVVDSPSACVASGKPETPTIVLVPENETPIMTTDELFDTLVGRPSVKKTYTRKSESPKKVPLPLVVAEGSSDLPKTDIDLWVESVVAAVTTPNRTTQVRLSQYSDITPHDSFDTQNVPTIDHQQEDTNKETLVSVVSPNELDNMEDKPSLPSASRKSHTPFSSKIARSLGNKRQTIGNFFSNMFGKLTVSPVTRVSITEKDSSEVTEENLNPSNGHESDGSEEVYHDSESDHPQESDIALEPGSKPSPNLRHSLRDTRKFIGHALTSLNTSRLTMDNTADIDESLLLREDESIDRNEEVEENYDLTDLSSKPDTALPIDESVYDHSSITTPSTSNRKTFSRDFRAEISPIVGGNNRVAPISVSTPAGRRSIRQRTDVDISPLAISLPNTPVKTSQSDTNNTSTVQTTPMRADDEPERSIESFAGESIVIEDSPAMVTSSDRQSVTLTPTGGIDDRSPLETRVSQSVPRSFDTNASHDEQIQLAEYNHRITDHSNLADQVSKEAIGVPNTDQETEKEPDIPSERRITADATTTLSTPIRVQRRRTTASTLRSNIKLKRNLRKSIAAISTTSPSSEDIASKTTSTNESSQTMEHLTPLQREPINTFDVAQSDTSLHTESETGEIDEREASSDGIKITQNISNVSELTHEETHDAIIQEAESSQVDIVDQPKQSTSETVFDSPVRQRRISLRQNDNDRLTMTVGRQVKKGPSDTPLLRKAVLTMCTPTRASRSAVLKTVSEKTTPVGQSRSSRRSYRRMVEPTTFGDGPTLTVEDEASISIADYTSDKSSRNTPRTRRTVLKTETPLSSPVTLLVDSPAVTTPAMSVTEDQLQIGDSVFERESAITNDTQVIDTSELSTPKKTSRSITNSATKESTSTDRSLDHSKTELHNKSISTENANDPPTEHNASTPIVTKDMSESIATPSPISDSPRRTSLRRSTMNELLTIGEGVENDGPTLAVEATASVSIAEHTTENMDEIVSSPSSITSRTRRSSSKTGTQVSSPALVDSPATSTASNSILEISTTGSATPTIVEHKPVSAADSQDINITSQLLTPKRTSRRITTNITKDMTSTDRSLDHSEIQIHNESDSTEIVNDSPTEYQEHTSILAKDLSESAAVSSPTSDSLRSTHLHSHSLRRSTMAKLTTLGEDVKNDSPTMVVKEATSVSIAERTLEKLDAAVVSSPLSPRTRRTISKADTPLSTPKAVLVDSPVSTADSATPVTEELNQTGDSKIELKPGSLDHSQHFDVKSKLSTPRRTSRRITIETKESTPTSRNVLTESDLHNKSSSPESVESLPTDHEKTIVTESLSPSVATPSPTSDSSRRASLRQSQTPRTIRSNDRLSMTTEKSVKKQVTGTPLLRKAIFAMCTPTRTTLNSVVTAGSSRRSTIGENVENEGSILDIIDEATVSIGEHTMEDLQESVTISSPSRQTPRIRGSSVKTETPLSTAMSVTVETPPSTRKSVLATLAAKPSTPVTVDQVQNEASIVELEPTMEDSSDVNVTSTFTTPTKTSARTSKRFTGDGTMKKSTSERYALDHTEFESKDESISMLDKDESEQPSVEVKEQAPEDLSELVWGTGQPIDVVETIEEGIIGGKVEEVLTDQSLNDKTPERTTRSSRRLTMDKSSQENVEELENSAIRISEKQTPRSRVRSSAAATPSSTSKQMHECSALENSAQVQESHLKDQENSTAAEDSTGTSIDFQSIQDDDQIEASNEILTEGACETQQASIAADEVSQESSTDSTPIKHTRVTRGRSSKSNTPATAPVLIGQPGQAVDIKTPLSARKSFLKPPQLLEQAFETTVKQVDSSIVTEEVTTPDKTTDRPQSESTPAKESLDTPAGVDSVFKTPRPVRGTRTPLSILKRTPATPASQVVGSDQKSSEKTRRSLRAKLMDNKVNETSFTSSESSSFAVAEFVSTPIADKKAQAKSASLTPNTRKSIFPQENVIGEGVTQEVSSIGSSTIVSPDLLKHLCERVILLEHEMENLEDSSQQSFNITAGNNTTALEGIKNLLETPAATSTVRKKLRSSTVVAELNQTTNEISGSSAQQIVSIAEVSMDSSIDETANNTDLEGIQQMLKTPSAQTPADNSSIKNVSVNLEGVHQLLKTPASITKRLSNSPKLPVVETSDENGDTTADLEGVQQMLAAPTPVSTQGRTTRNSTTALDNTMHLSGVRRLLQTPISGSNDSYNLDGVKQMLKTPSATRVRKLGTNDTSANLEGIEQLLKTPAAPKSRKHSEAAPAANDSFANLEDIEQHLKTPEASVYKDLSKIVDPATKNENDSTVDMEGIQQMMMTPNINKRSSTTALDSTMALDSIKKLLKTPAADRESSKDSYNLQGVKQMLRTPSVRARKPAANDISANLEGIERLLKTPLSKTVDTTAEVENDNTVDMEGVQATSIVKEASMFAKTRSTRSSTATLDTPTQGKGVKKLLRTSVAVTGTPNNSTYLEGVERMLKTPSVARVKKLSAKDTSAILEGIEQLLKTPAASESKRSSGIVDTTTEIEDDNTVDMEGVQQMLATPITNEASMSTKTRSTSSSTAALDTIVPAKGVKNLLETSDAVTETSNNSTNLEGIEQMLKTPSVARVKTEASNNVSVDLEGVEKLLKTPVASVSKKHYTIDDDNSVDMEGVQQMLTTPIAKEASMSTQSRITRSSTAHLETPIVDRKLRNDSYNLEGIEQMLKTPSVVHVNKPVSNDTSANMEGIGQLPKTPARFVSKEPSIIVDTSMEAEDNDTVDMKGLQQMLTTPIASKASVSSQRTLLKSPLIDESIELDGVQKLFKTPSAGRSRNTNPAVNDTSVNLEGINQLLKTSGASVSKNISTIAETSSYTDDVEGKDIYLPSKNRSTRKSSAASDSSLHLEGVQKLLETPMTTKKLLNDSHSLEGVQQLMQTPASVRKSIVTNVMIDSVSREMFETSNEDDMPNVEENDLSTTSAKSRKTRTSTGSNSAVLDGIQQLLKTPTANRPSTTVSSPSLTGVGDLMRTPATTTSLSPKNTSLPETPGFADFEGLQQMFKTPIASSTVRKPLRSLTSRTTSAVLCESSNLEGVQRLLATPPATQTTKSQNESTSLEGVEQLLKTPVTSTVTNELNPTTTPKASSDDTNLEGVQQIFKTPIALPVTRKHIRSNKTTPKLNESINFDGVQQLLRTPVSCTPTERSMKKRTDRSAVNISDNLEGVDLLLKTPIDKTDVSPNDSIRESTPLVKQQSMSAVSEGSVNVEGVAPLMKTPETSQSAPESQSASETATELDTNSSNLFTPPEDDQQSHSAVVNITGILQMLETSVDVPVNGKISEGINQENIKRTPSTILVNVSERPQNATPSTKSSQHPQQSSAAITTKMSVDVAVEIGTPRMRRKLYTKNDPDDKTPERISTSLLRPVTSDEYLHILDHGSTSSDEKRNRRGKNMADPANESTDSESNYGEVDEPVRKVLPSRASRSNIKTLSEEELAGASPELKYVKPKVKTIVEEPAECQPTEPLSTIDEESDLIIQNLPVTRRKVMFNEHIQVKEINSPAIVGEIIQKVSRRVGQKSVQVIITQSSNQPPIKPARRENKHKQEEEHIVSEHANEESLPKRSRRAVKKVNYGIDEDNAKADEVPKRSRRGVNKVHEADDVTIETAAVEKPRSRRGARKPDIREATDPSEKNGYEEQPKSLSGVEKTEVVEESTSDATETIETSKEIIAAEPIAKQSRRAPPKSKTVSKKSSSRAKSTTTDNNVKENTLREDQNLAQLKEVEVIDKSEKTYNETSEVKKDTTDSPSSSVTKIETSRETEEEEKSEEESIPKRTRRAPAKAKAVPKKSSSRAKSTKSDAVSDEVKIGTSPTKVYLIENNGEKADEENLEIKKDNVSEETNTNVTETSGNVSATIEDSKEDSVEQEEKPKRVRRAPAKSKQAPTKSSSRSRSKKVETVVEENGEEKKVPTPSQANAETDAAKEEANETVETEEEPPVKRARVTKKTDTEPRKPSRGRSKKTDKAEHAEMSQSVNQDPSFEDVSDITYEPETKRSRRAPRKKNVEIVSSRNMLVQSSSGNQNTSINDEIHEGSDTETASGRAKRGTKKTTNVSKNVKLSQQIEEPPENAEENVSKSADKVERKSPPKPETKSRQRRAAAKILEISDDVSPSTPSENIKETPHTTPITKVAADDQIVTDVTKKDDSQPAKRGRNARKLAAPKINVDDNVDQPVVSKNEAASMPPPAKVTPGDTETSKKRGGNKLSKAAPTRRDRQKATVEEESNSELHLTVEESLNESHMVKTMLPSSHTSTPLLQISEEVSRSRNRRAEIIESQTDESETKMKRSRTRTVSRIKSVDDSHEQPPPESVVPTIVEEDETLPTSKGRTRKNPPTKRTRGKTVEQSETEEVIEVAPKRPRKAPGKKLEVEESKTDSIKKAIEDVVESTGTISRNRRGATSTKQEVESSMAQAIDTTNDKSENVQAKTSKSRKPAAAKRKKADIVEDSTDNETSEVAKQSVEGSVESSSSRRRPMRSRK